MARREINRLSTPKVRQLVKRDKPGLFADGAGLWLDTTSGASWVYRFMIDGRSRAMGLGALHTVSLAEAREAALMARKLVREGVDPIDKREADLAAARREQARHKLFKDCAREYIAANRAGWRNGKHNQQWENTLRSYAYPVLGDLPVAEIDTPLVTRVLLPIWTTKTVTAMRLRQRVEAILDFAKALGYRDGENPARWSGNLESILPKGAKVLKREHHAALPWAEIGDFVAKLRGQPGLATGALQFTIYTATRTGEVLGAKPEEFDLDNALWTVPASRTKTGKEHRVPLSAPALEIAKRRIEAGGEFLFPGVPGKSLSNMSMLVLLRRMGRDDLTVHGFRSTFRDWAAERTNYPREVAEMALGHAVGDKVEAAYRRGDLFDKRRRLMDQWAQFCASPESVKNGSVHALRR